MSTTVVPTIIIGARRIEGVAAEGVIRRACTKRPRMTADTTRLEALMADAVEVSVRHVESGGVPFAGQLVADDGWVSDPGVNLVRETDQGRW